MSATQTAPKPRPEPYIWPTWIVGLLASDDQCHWAPWFKAHFKYAKRERNDFDLTRWKADHGEMVKQRADELRAAGWTVYLEDQNKISIVGKTGITLGGTPDIVAVKDGRALVVDCKGGKRRDKDYFQVCLYMVFLPMTHEACKGLRVEGEIRYRDAPVKIHPDEADEVKDRIVAQLQESGGADEPRRVPSRRECRFCDISAQDCPDRIDDEAGRPTVASDDF